MKRLLKLGTAAAAAGAFVLLSLPANAGGLLGSCYVRGDVGYARGANDDAKGAAAGAAIGPVTGVDFDDTWFGEIGFGCGSAQRESRMDYGGSIKDAPVVSVGPSLRGDVTLGFRGERDYYGVPPTPPAVIDPVTFKLRTFTTLFNLYLDLPVHRGITPYVGAGIGFAVHDVGDATFRNGAVVTVKGGTETDFAWALMGGVGIDVGRGITLDIGYRYADLGDIKIDNGGADFNPCVCVTNLRHAVAIEDLTTHEFKVGVRIPLSFDRAPEPLK